MPVLCERACCAGSEREAKLVDLQSAAECSLARLESELSVCCAQKRTSLMLYTALLLDAFSLLSA